jgi:transcriptional regulator with XRE-family HTH domain
MDGKKLKEARKILGLSQEEMAAKIHVSFPTYNGYENGKNIPKNKHIIINNVLKEATSREKELITDEVFKRESKDILIEVLLELKALRKENEEKNDLIVQIASKISDESKINLFSNSQMDMLKDIVKNLSSEVEKIKKADLKKSASAEK